MPPALRYRDSSVSQADLIAGIDDGSSADSRSVVQIPSRHIGDDGRVDGGVVKEACPWRCCARGVEGAHRLRWRCWSRPWCC